ncbi:AMP-binding protein [Acidimangrovimonas pyrenivorans]|uniref:AMP-binding protein n=1 Tax=Acidimangrovimonas pyrenivorans TaxID=2030798 RepID=A0ABV7AGT8_9RHOB
MDRRLFRVRPESDDSDWASLRTGFRWSIPAHFNIAEMCCDSWAREEPDRVALIDLAGGGAREWTYGQLKDASDRLANAFRARGLKKGDRVGVLLPQGAAVPIAHFAAQKLGAVALPLFTLFGAEALTYRLSDSAAKIVVTDGENLDKLMALRPDLPELAEVYSIDGAAGEARDLWAEIAAASPEITPEPTLAEDPAVLIYTSGTTGAPKGVLHAHRFLLGHLPSMELTHEGFPQPDDRGWTPADWAWIGGLMDMAMPCLYYGVPLIARRMRKFDPAEAYAMIAEHRIRNLFLPPTALKLMRGTPVPEGVNIRSVSSGGESLGAEMLAWGRETLGAPINELYGQTECNLVVSMCAGFMAVKPGAMGQALPGHDVAVLREDGSAAAPDELGEIAVRRGSPSMFLEYLNKPEQTAAKFDGDWMRTGDLGRRDAEGYFTYVARDDDVITSAGYRIGPTEIEDCLTGHPDVVMAAVIGVPDKLRTEVVKAFVILREGADWEGMERILIDRVKARVSPHVAPRSVVKVDSLPMTTTGKIMRRELRARETGA